MRTEGLYVAGIGTHLPPATKVADAVAAGRYDPEEAEDTDLESVCEAGPDQTPPDMAVAAARTALARSGHRPEEVGLVLHASIYFQGLELYSTASYIHRAALGDHSALAFEVKHASNGGMTALDVAARYLAAPGGPVAALVTTADKCTPPVVDRWNCDIGTVLGDGATAMVLSRRGGFAQVLSTRTVSDPTLERLHRGDEPFAAHSDSATRVDLRSRKLQYLAEAELDDFTRRFRTGLRDCVDGALAEAGVGFEQVGRFVLPHSGRVVLQREYLRELGVTEDRTTWSWGRTVGHVGAGDQISGLGHLAGTGAVGPGDHCLLLGVGAGFTWTAAVVRVLDRPSWTGV